MQQSQHILLVRPSHFVFNNQTAGSNTFQHTVNEPESDVSSAAIREFETFAEKLSQAGVSVTVVNDTDFPIKPDAVFPNNWISTHRDGTVIIYPMFAVNRRTEKRADIIELLKEKFVVNKVIDLSDEEKNNRFLEGTGSIIFDHINKIAYACLSPRTNKDLFEEICTTLRYHPVSFRAYDRAGKEIYHTNVMMSVAEKFSLICLECITDENEKEIVKRTLEETGHSIIEISISQMNHFAGNVLSVKNKKLAEILVMSESAFVSLTDEQRAQIRQFCEILPMPVKTIEHIGGGSARCMMAEIFLPSKQQQTANGK